MNPIDTGTEHLLGHVEDGVAVLMLNRPERRNALSHPMTDALGTVLSELEDDDQVGAILLRGAGGTFCAGGDVHAMAARAGQSQAEAADAALLRQRKSQRDLYARMWELAKPTIAAIDGAAAGAGLSLALACDLRYASSDALLTTAFAKVGFSGDGGGSWFLSRLVGPSKALELYYFSDKVPASEALALGIVNDVFPSASFEAQVMERAHRLAAGPRIAHRYMKENIHRSIEGGLRDVLDLEAANNKRSGATHDHAEGMRAFVEKRPPVFEGR